MNAAGSEVPPLLVSSAVADYVAVARSRDRNVEKFFELFENALEQHPGRPANGNGRQPPLCRPPPVPLLRFVLLRLRQLCLYCGLITSVGSPANSVNAKE